MMKKQDTLRRLPLFLAMIVALSLLISGTVFAEEAEVPEPAVRESDGNYFTTVEEAAGYLREQMEARVSPVTFGFVTESSDESFLNEILDAALVHTGAGTEGDYLVQQFKGAGYGYDHAMYENGAYHIDDVTYTISYYTTSEQEAALTEEINSVLASLDLDGKTDFEKFSVIYDYIIKNVTYDYERINEDISHTAYAAMVEGRAVCQGYANLLYRMLLEAGIDNRIVTGWVYNGEGEAPDLTDDEDTNIANHWERHAWNIVKLGDVYYNVDATWDSNGVIYTDNAGNEIWKDYPLEWRLKTGATFPDHIRDDAFAAPGFCTDYPMCEADYPVPSFMRQSVVLSGEIGVNIFMDLDMLTESEREGSCMTFSVGNKEAVSVDFNPEFKNTEGLYYGFTCYVNSIQMADTITATYHYGNGATVEKRFSLERYIYSRFPDADDKEQGLLAALNDYGYYAQQFLKDIHSWVLGTDYRAMRSNIFTNPFDYDEVKTSTETYKAQMTLNKDLDKVSISLNLKSTTSLSLYVTPAEGYGGSISAAIGAKALKAVKQTDGSYKITIPGISAHQLGDMYTVEIETESGKSTVTASALSYVYAGMDVLEDPGKNLLCAINQYYTMAMMYKNSESPSR